MPLYDFECEDCKKISEFLLTGNNDNVTCQNCGSKNLKKLLSAHSSLSGPAKSGFPSANDTACCGSHPGQAAGCAGPGSCCGKVPS
ncbi:MAG: FmdB family zinc ribbon protein [Desulfobacterales bacterium]